MFEIIAYTIDKKYATNYGQTCIGFRDHINKIAGHMGFISHDYNDIINKLYVEFTFKYATIFNWEL